MNPLDLAQEVAAQNELELGQVSPVYAELAEMAVAAVPEEPIAPVPEGVGRVSEAVELMQRAEKYRQWAAEERDKAFAITTIGPVQPAHLASVLLAFGKPLQDAEALSAARDAVATIDRGELLIDDQVEAILAVAEVFQDHDSIRAAIDTYNRRQSKKTEGVIKDYFIRLTRLIYEAQGVESAKSYANSIMLQERLPALAYIGQVSHDQGLLDDVFAQCHQLFDFDPQESMRILTKVYRINHADWARDEALQIARENHLFCTGELFDIAAQDLSRERIDDILKYTREHVAFQKATNENYHNENGEYLLDNANWRTATLLARRGDFDAAQEALGRIDMISGISVWDLAMSDVCAELCERGDLEHALIVMQNLPLGTMERVRAQDNYKVALATAGRTEEVERILPTIDQSHYMLHARLAVALSKRAQYLDMQAKEAGS